MRLTATLPGGHKWHAKHCVACNTKGIIRKIPWLFGPRAIQTKCFFSALFEFSHAPELLNDSSGPRSQVTSVRSLLTVCEPAEAVILALGANIAWQMPETRNITENSQKV